MRIAQLACCLVIATSITISNARRNRGVRHERAKTVGCRRPHRFDSKQVCEVGTNCKFGGRCTKVAELKRHGTTVRFIMPPHIQSLTTRNGTGRGGRQGRTSTSILEDLAGKGLSGGSEVCVCDFDCSRTTAPSKRQNVCGSNGYTYESKCHLRQDACRCQSDVKINWKGPCEENSRDSMLANRDRTTVVFSNCDSTCSYGATCDGAGTCKCNIECHAQALSHVCGKDGRTYTNECHVRRAQCRYQMGIDILHSGPCNAEERLMRREEPKLLDDMQTNVNPCESLDCDAAMSDPLCGSDDISYPNECVLKHASCIKGQRIEIKHTEFCQQFEVPTSTEITTAISMAPSVSSTSEEKDPCQGIICHHGGICVEHDEYVFICSCEKICDQNAPYSSPERTSPNNSLRALAARWTSARVVHSMTGPLDSAARYDLLSKKDVLKVSSLQPAYKIAEVKIEPEIIRLDEEKGVKSAWAEETGDSFDMNVRVRKRRNKNSRRRRRREGIQRSRRSIDGLRPVTDGLLCGTDGKTYKNECEMKTEGCYRKRTITIAHRGACRMEVIQPPAETANYTSITMFDGQNDLVEREEDIDLDDIKPPTTSDKIVSNGKRNYKRNGRRNKKRRNRENERKKSNGLIKSINADAETQDKDVSFDVVRESSHLPRTRGATEAMPKAISTVIEHRDENIEPDIMDAIDQADETSWYPTKDHIKLRDENVDSSILRKPDETNVTSAGEFQDGDMELGNESIDLDITVDSKIKKISSISNDDLNKSSELKDDNVESKIMTDLDQPDEKPIGESVEMRDENVDSDLVSDLDQTDGKLEKLPEQQDEEVDLRDKKVDSDLGQTRSGGKPAKLLEQQMELRDETVDSDIVSDQQDEKSKSQYKNQDESAEVRDENVDSDLDQSDRKTQRFTEDLGELNERIDKNVDLDIMNGLKQSGEIPKMLPESQNDVEKLNHENSGPVLKYQEELVEMRDENIDSKIVDSLDRENEAQENLPEHKEELLKTRDEKVHSDIIDHLDQAIKHENINPNVIGNPNSTISPKDSDDEEEEQNVQIQDNKKEKESTNGSVHELHDTQVLDTTEESANEMTLLAMIPPNNVSTEDITLRSHSPMGPVGERTKYRSLTQKRKLRKNGSVQDILRIKAEIVKKRIEQRINNASDSQNNRRKTDNSSLEVTSESTNGVSVVTLALALGLGQLVVVVVLVGIFVYMKKRKKLKDVTDHGTKANTVTSRQEKTPKTTQII